MPATVRRKGASICSIKVADALDHILGFDSDNQMMKVIVHMSVPGVKQSFMFLVRLKHSH